MKSDLLSLVEASYGEHAPETWEQRIIECAGVLDRGLGVCLQRVEWGSDGLRLSRLFGTTSGAERLMRACQEYNAANPEIGARALQPRNSGKSTSQLLRGRLLRSPAAASEVAGVLERAGVRDVIGLACTIDPRALVLVLVPSPRVVEVDRRTVARYRLVGVHLGAGRRLAEGVARDEAVLDPNGRLLHAEGAARFARDELRRRAVAIDRARTKSRRADVDVALSLWRGLVAGRWSLVERFERDGRRLMIARKNPPRVRSALALTETEKRVVELLVFGQRQKYIAYTLGLSESVVSLHLQRATFKLGVRSRADLIAVVNALGPTPAA